MRIEDIIGSERERPECAGSKRQDLPRKNRPQNRQMGAKVSTCIYPLNARAHLRFGRFSNRKEAAALLSLLQADATEGGQTVNSLALFTDP